MTINSDTQELTKRETRNPQVQGLSDLQPMDSSAKLQDSVAAPDRDINSQAQLVSPNTTLKVEQSSSQNVLTTTQTATDNLPATPKGSGNQLILIVSSVTLLILIGTALMWTFNRSAKKLAKRPK